MLRRKASNPSPHSRLVGSFALGLLFGLFEREEKVSFSHSFLLDFRGERERKEGLSRRTGGKGAKSFLFSFSSFSFLPCQKREGYTAPLAAATGPTSSSLISGAEKFRRGGEERREPPLMDFRSSCWAPLLQPSYTTSEVSRD